MGHIHSLNKLCLTENSVFYNSRMSATYTNIIRLFNGILASALFRIALKYPEQSRATGS